MELNKVSLTYEQFYNLFSKEENGKEVFVEKGFFVKTPSGEFSPIHGVIAKPNEEIVRLNFFDGDSLECSSNHTLSYDGKGVAAENAILIDSIHGKKEVSEISPLGFETVFDISIPSPHWYISKEESGIIHHNTWFALSIVQTFLENNPTAGVFYIDTEAAVTKQMMQDRGIDVKRVIIMEPETVEQFRHQVLQILDNYGKSKEKPPMMFVLDSLGNMSTEKEMKDSLEGSDKRDMTRAQLIRGTFRTIGLRLAKHNVPMLLTNHIYANVGGYGPPSSMAGGGGVKYFSSTICFLSKAKEKDGTDVIGNIITVNFVKNRFAKENTKVGVRLTYGKGLDRYYGLEEVCIKAGIWKKLPRQIELQDGTKIFGKQLLANPEKYFTEEVLLQIDEYCGKMFMYGQGNDDEDVNTNEDEDFDNDEE